MSPNLYIQSYAIMLSFISLSSKIGGMKEDINTIILGNSSINDKVR